MEETLKTCQDCGYEGPEDVCPECGGEMVPSDDVEESEEDEVDDEEDFS
jgi:hypothetical protein